MPIKPENKHFYSANWRTVVRPRILNRADGRCERCGVPNGARVLRAGLSWWLSYGAPQDVKIVLTVAHLNQVPGHDDDDNLAALCQYCHLNHDRIDNLQKARQTRLHAKETRWPPLPEFFSALEALDA